MRKTARSSAPSRCSGRALEGRAGPWAGLVLPAEIAAADKLDADEQVVLAYEFKDGINRYLATRQGGGPRTLAELIAFNDRQVTREMPFFGQELFVEAQARGPLSDPQYLEAHARALRRAGAEGIDAALAENQPK